MSETRDAVQVPSSGPTEPSEVLLHCLGGAPAPSWLRRALSALFDLPDDANEALWAVLEPSLDEVIDARTERALDAFTSGYELSQERVAAAVRGSRFVLRAAARVALKKELFVDDLAALVGSAAHPALRTLVDNYDAAMARMRAEILGRTLSEHGNLVKSVGWRLDRVGASDRGEPIGAPIAMLSFRYKNGDKEELISLQILPDKLRELRAICDKILS